MSEMIYEGILYGMTKEAKLGWLARRAAKKRAALAEPLHKEIAKDQLGRAKKGAIAGGAVGAVGGAATAEPGSGFSGAVKGGLIGAAAGGGIGGLTASKASKLNLAKLKTMSERTKKGKIFV